MSSEVSVLIPAHGPSPFIKFTLESILNNTVQPEEVLIIDDGLGNQAIAQIDPFLRSLPILIIPNDGKGLVDALNTGLRVAQGKYIARIDNDDLMAENRIERQLAQFESDPNLVAVGSQCNYINSEGIRTGRSNYPIGALNKLPDFKFKCLIAHPSTMYLRGSALDIGGYRSIVSWNGVDIAEDFDFWLRISKEGKISVFEELLTEYRQHASQLSSQHLAGQQVGTPYISAVNIGSEANPVKIVFKNGKSDQLLTYLNSIREGLGFRWYLASKLGLHQFREERFSSNIITKRLVSRFISLLQKKN
jgi:glycosyltransferase involved in cell wall biosynthesis